MQSSRLSTRETAREHETQSTLQLARQIERVCHTSIPDAVQCKSADTAMWLEVSRSTTRLNSFWCTTQ